MLRTIFFIALIASAALGLSWLADRPGDLRLEWLGYTIETTVFAAAVALIAIVGALLWLWSVLVFVLTRPGAISQWRKERKKRQGYEALSRGMIAVGAGDKTGAAQNASIARRALPNEPLTALLRAQAAQMNGARQKARQLFETMLSSPDTEMLGLRGLYLEARRENDPEAARQFVERAVRKDPDLGWSINALFEMQSRSGDWASALQTLATARTHGHIDPQTATRQRAVLLTAQAMEKEETASDEALTHAKEAHNLAPGFVPAAAIAARLLGARGETQRATKLIARTWRTAPHPELAGAYAHARAGDAPADRLRRVRRLAGLSPNEIEGRIAVASAALDAREWDEARAALSSIDRPPSRVCVLMARIERAQHDDKGREREWLARAVRAPRDPVWIADSYISERWLPVSPVTGALDAFEWRAPVEAVPYLTDDSVDAPAERDEPPARPQVYLPQSETRGSEPASIAVRMAEATLPAPDADTSGPAQPEPKLIGMAAKAIAVPSARAARPVEVDSYSMGRPSQRASYTFPGTVRQPAATVAAPVNEGVKDSDVTVAKRSNAPLKESSANAMPPLVARPAKPSSSAPAAVQANPQKSPATFFPHTPDDPGIDASDAEDVVTPLARYRQPSR